MNWRCLFRHKLTFIGEHDENTEGHCKTLVKRYKCSRPGCKKEKVTRDVWIKISFCPFCEKLTQQNFFYPHHISDQELELAFDLNRPNLYYQCLNCWEMMPIDPDNSLPKD